MFELCYDWWEGLSELVTPPEPKELKELARSLASSGISARYVLWLGNRLPKYLWGYWGKELRRLGVRWQDFLSLFSELGEEVDAWISGELSWEEFVASLKARLPRGGEEGQAGLLKWVRGKRG